MRKYHETISILTRSCLSLALIAGLGGCFGDDIGSGTRNAGGDDDVGDTDGGGGGGYDNDDCKLEGSAIGTDGATVYLGSRSVMLTDWVAKSDSPGEYVGFTVVTSDGSTVGYVVKTGGDLWHSTDVTWMHPGGMSGPDASGISNVDFCEECEGGDCDPPDDGGECNDPDGCDPGDGGSCTDPEGCDPDPDPGCTDPDGCDGGPDACDVNADCPSGEFCEGGECVPVVL
jgi:hypothetical protein